MKSVVVIATVLFSVLATPAAAQQTAPPRTLPPELRDGRDALSFGANLGGASMGWSHMMSARTAFTLDLHGYGDFTTGDVEEADTLLQTREHLVVRVTLEPGFRRYMSGRGEVASYFAANLLFGVDGYYNENLSDSDSYSNESWAPVAGAGVALGLDWFVTDQLSLRGQIGARGTYSYRFYDTASNGRLLESREHMVHVNLGSTGLAATLWF